MGTIVKNVKLQIAQIILFMVVVLLKWSVDGLSREKEFEFRNCVIF